MPSSNRRNSDRDTTRKYNMRNAKKKRRSNTTNKRDTRATRRVPTQNINRKGKGKKSKNREGKFSAKHPKLMMAIKIFILVFLLLCVIGAGVVAGVFFGLFGDDFEITKEELTIGAANSVVVDQNGAVIAELSGDEKRKIISLEDMADYLPKAYVAMEDERFYQHSGVDIKRTAGAILNTLLGNSSYGGSTITQQLAENYVYSSGLTIYSTVDTNIQTQMEEEFAKDRYIVAGRDVDSETGEKKNDHSQAAMVVIDYKTGNVVGTVGGLGEKTESRGLNRATQSVRQTGSSIKPIAVVAPALQEKVITASTVYKDQETDFGGNYIPKNQSGYTNQNVNIRYFIAKSLNVPAVKIMRELSPSTSIEYLNKMGLSHINTDEDADLSLALGGTTNGATPLEMAAAYSTIANDGVYITPTFYTKVVDSSGNTVLTPKQEQTRVISEQNAYIVKSILQEPVKSGGTATYCAISGMDVAAKTGTTDDDYDRWLCGFTPYYAAACWFGYDQPETVPYSGNPAGNIWDGVMTAIHEDLENATFTRPSGIVEQTVCRTTGCLATTGCNNKYTEIFTQDNLPEQCEGHGSQTICSESGLVATEYCSQYCEVRQNYYGEVLPKEQLGLWTPVNGSNSSGTRVNGTCTLHTEPKVEEPARNTTPSTNTTNTTNSTGGGNTTSGGGNIVEEPSGGGENPPSSGDNTGENGNTTSPTENVVQ